MRTFFTFLPFYAIINFMMNSIDTNKQAAAADSAITSAQQGTGQPIDLKLIVFDMGKVFIHFDWERTYEAFVNVIKADPQSVKDAFAAVYFPYECGQISTNDVIDHLNNTLDAQLTHSVFAKLWTITLDEDKEMTQLLQSLRKQLPLYLLSNINEVSFGYVQDKFNVAQHFEELVLSYKVGHLKPASEIYHEVLNRSKLPAQNCLFIDDMPENIEAAQSLGMHGIQFTGINDLRLKLPQFGIQV